jgi:hypothetical protein
MNITPPDANAEAIAIVVGLLYAVGRWAVGKISGKKQESFGTLIDEAVTAELEDALEDGETLDTIEDRLTTAIAKLALKAGFKVPEQVVKIAVQAGVLKFRKLVKARAANQKAARELPGQAGELATAAAGVAAELGKLKPTEAIDTIAVASAAGVELLSIGPDGKLGPAQ